MPTWLWVAVGLPGHLRQTVPDAGSQLGLKSGRKGSLCRWRLLPALPWQHICFLHFPAPCQGRAPAPPASTRTQEKSKSQQNTFSPVSHSPGCGPLFNDCTNLYSPAEFVLLLLLLCSQKCHGTPEHSGTLAASGPATPFPAMGTITSHGKQPPTSSPHFFPGLRAYICPPWWLDEPQVFLSGPFYRFPVKGLLLWEIYSKPPLMSWCKLKLLLMHQLLTHQVPASLPQRRHP